MDTSSIPHFDGAGMHVRRMSSSMQMSERIRFWLAIGFYLLVRLEKSKS